MSIWVKYLQKIPSYIFYKYWNG